LGRSECANFDVHDYYTEDYFSGGHRDGYADYCASEPVLRREFARTVQFVRQYRNGGRLLEIGCAYGFFLEEARHFYDVTGIEIADAAAVFCRGRGLTVINGMADEDNLARLGMMDVIVLLDVIEHLPDPQSTLALCRRYLNPGGVVIVTTGDFSSLYARVAGRNWRLMTPPLVFHTREHATARANGAVEIGDLRAPLETRPVGFDRVSGAPFARRKAGNLDRRHEPYWHSGKLVRCDAMRAA
jgi:SAM-dependent methyltransferase